MNRLWSKIKISLFFIASILNLHKCSNTNVYYNIKSKLGKIIYFKLRRFEKNLIKQSKLSQHLEFLRTCLTYNLSPTFIKYKTSVHRIASSFQYKHSLFGMLLFDYREKSNIWNKLNLYNLLENTDLEIKFKQEIILTFINNRILFSKRI